MKSIGAKINYVLLLVFVICAAGILVVNSQINSMGNITNEISQKYIESVKEVDTISEYIVNLKSQMLDYLLAPEDKKSSKLGEITKTQGAIVTSFQKLKESATTDRAKDAVTKLEQSYGTYKDKYNSVIKQIDSKTITDAASIDNQLSKLYSALEISVQSVEVQNTVNTVRAQKSLESSTTTSRMVFVAVGVLLVVVFIISVIFAKFCITRPAKIATKELQNIIHDIEDNNGNLTVRVTQKSKDEIGQLVAGVNKFIEVLDGIISEIQNDTADVKKSVNVVYGQIGTADSNIMDVSATMQQLAAGMTEMSTTAEHISGQTDSISQSMEDIAKEADNGSAMAKDIKVKAVKLKEEGIESKENTSKLADEIREAVKASLEKSKDVEKINELTDNILSISSRNTANDIQAISRDVTNSVGELADNANKMIDFIINVVMPDYDKLVNIGEQYNEDAEDFDNILQHFTDNATQLKQTMVDVATLIKGMSVTISENSDGVTMVSNNAGGLTEGMSQIKEEMLHTESATDRLDETVGRFTRI